MVRVTVLEPPVVVNGAVALRAMRSLASLKAACTSAWRSGWQCGTAVLAPPPIVLSAQRSALDLQPFLSLLDAACTLWHVGPPKLGLAGPRPCHRCGGAFVLRFYRRHREATQALSRSVPRDVDRLSRVRLGLHDLGRSDGAVRRRVQGGTRKLPHDERWSYPINKCTGEGPSVESAVHAVGRGSKGDAEKGNEIRRHIIDAASKEGCSDQIPDNWNSDGSLDESKTAAQLAAPPPPPAKSEATEPPKADDAVDDEAIAKAIDAAIALQEKDPDGTPTPTTRRCSPR